MSQNDSRLIAHPADSNVDRYTRTAVALHWFIAVCLLAQIGFGWYLEEIPRGTPARSWYVNLHKSTGLTLALAILFRLYWRLRHTPPPYPVSMPAWQRVAAPIGHWMLYACMIVMPSSGYIASNFSKWGVKYFNTISLPPWGIDDKNIYGFFQGVHVTTSYVLVSLIVVHIVAAISHVVTRDGLFARMSFRSASDASRPRS